MWEDEDFGNQIRVSEPPATREICVKIGSYNQQVLSHLSLSHPYYLAELGLEKYLSIIPNIFGRDGRE